MKYFIAILTVGTLGAIAGCSPTAPANGLNVEAPPKDVKEFSLTLLPGPWEKYLSAPPKILILTHSTKGIQDLLT